MFILRVIIKNKTSKQEESSGLHATYTEHLQTNQVLGDSYNLIEKSYNPIEFESAADVYYGKDCDKSDRHRSSAYAFIVYKEGTAMRPLYQNQDAYIMTSDGKTFSRIKDNSNTKDFTNED